MKDWNVIRDRYLRDGLPIRLGGLAANLGRIKSFAAYDEGQMSVMDLLEESKYFIEWTAAEADSHIAAELVRLQVQLALWQLNWRHVWDVDEKRKNMVDECAVWSRYVLEISGLLDDEGLSHVTQTGNVHP